MARWLNAVVFFRSALRVTYIHKDQTIEDITDKIEISERGGYLQIRIPVSGTLTIHDAQIIITEVAEELSDN